MSQENISLLNEDGLLLIAGVRPFAFTGKDGKPVTGSSIHGVLFDLDDNDEEKGERGGRAFESTVEPSVANLIRQLGWYRPTWRMIPRRVEGRKLFDRKLVGLHFVQGVPLPGVVK